MTDAAATLTDMSGGATDDAVPAQRREEREVGIRDLRNAGRVLAELAEAGAVGRVTSGGHLVGWLLPATADERRVEELVAAGRLVRGRGGLTGRRPLPARSGQQPVGAALQALRDEETR